MLELRKESLLGGASVRGLGASLGLSLGVVWGTLIPCVGGAILIGWQWWVSRGSGHTGANMGMERESIRRPVKSTGLAPVHHLVGPVTQTKVTFPPGTSLLPLSVKQAETHPFQHHTQQTSCWELWSPGRRRVDPGTDIQRDTSHPWRRGPKFASLPFPEEGDDSGVG